MDTENLYESIKFGIQLVTLQTVLCIYYDIQQPLFFYLLDYLKS